MKNRILFFVIFLAVALVASAQKHGHVKISEKQSEAKTVKLDGTVLYFTSTPSRSEGMINLRVEIKNNEGDQGHDFLLFEKSFSKKELKKQKPSIRFDRIHGANMINKSLSTCPGLTNKGVILISRGETNKLMIEDVPTNYNLPINIYLANKKPKGFLRKEKFIITELLDLDVDIEVESESRQNDDDALSRLERDYDDLMDELDRQRFCNNRKHDPSLSEQEEPYKKRISDAIEEIENIKDDNRWRESSKEYKPYKALKQKYEFLSSDFKKYERDCGGHRITGTGGGRPVHDCNYCSMTSGDVLRSIENDYIKLKNKKADRSSVVSHAEALHRAWSSSCPNLKRKIQQDSSKSAKINDYYNKIVNY